MNIAFVGVGNVGMSLALALRETGCKLEGVNDIDPGVAASAAQTIGSRVFWKAEDFAQFAGVVFLTVPDHYIEQVCSEIAAAGGFQPGSVVLHTSGALSSQVLISAREAGCGIGSFHPLQTFPDPISGAKSLAGSYVTIEGDETAMRACRELARKLQCHSMEIPSDAKPLYHAAACVLSNYMVAVVDIGLKLLEASGVDKPHSLDAVKPLLDATLQNILNKGTVNALTGPVARGDYATVEKHIHALQQHQPAWVDIYKALGKVTLEIAEQKNMLTTEQKIRLIQIFEHPL